MILRPFFRRHFLMTAVVFLTILTMSSYLSHYLNHMDCSDFYKTHGDLFLQAVEKHGGDKLAYIRNLNTITRELGFQVDADVIRDGKSLLTGTEKAVPQVSEPDSRIFTETINVPEPATLVLDFSNPNGPRHAMSWTFLVMTIAILLASALSMFLLFWSFRDRAEMAKDVLMRMQQGDLKARFPTTRLDEVGHMMKLFNEMADEIERLVEQLKLNEKHRLQLLQELTHDLRTPVSSLRNLIETLRFEDARLEAKSKAELMDLAYQETEYLTRLVEDLLFLALVLEPKYKEETGEISVKELLLAQIDAAAAAYPAIKSEFTNNCSDKSLKLTGNAHLMQRLFRNALENAFSFARTKVETQVIANGGFVSIVIRDDGPGLSPEALESYGKKRSTRYQGLKHGGRLSVGLGSVIIQAIAAAHGGHSEIKNLLGGQGAILGTELSITIRVEEEPAT